MTLTLDFQARFAHAADGMCVLDASLVVVEVNDALAAFVGTTRAAMPGRPATDFIQQEDLRLRPPRTETVAQEGSAITMRLFQRPDGILVEGEVAAARLPDGGMLCGGRLGEGSAFYTTKSSLEGTGLGLSTVYGIVRQSGGAVTLASTPGQGTQVTILLPLSGRAETKVAASRPESGVMPAGTRKSRCVLLVEDEPQVRVQARRLLERCGFSVLEAVDGADGLRLFEARRADIDAIVTDVMMPRLSGVGMVSRVRALAPEVPVVFVSGFTAGDRDMPLDARTVFLPKPYTMASLCGAIEAAVAG